MDEEDRTSEVLKEAKARNRSKIVKAERAKRKSRSKKPKQKQHRRTTIKQERTCKKNVSKERLNESIKVCWEVFQEVIKIGTEINHRINLRILEVKSSELKQNSNNFKIGYQAT